MPPTQKVSVPPFTIEANLPRNGHLMIQAIPGRPRLRSAFDAAKPVRRGGHGPDADDMIVPTSQNAAFGDHPAIPGQRISVDPGAGTYVITDPMRDNVRMLGKVVRWLSAKAGGGAENRNGFETTSGKLDVHRMKSLCREMWHVVNNGDGRIIEGPEFSLEDCDDLPGRYLQNPGSAVRTSQPQFEDQMEKWEETLNAVGG